MSATRYRGNIVTITSIGIVLSSLGVDRSDNADNIYDNLIANTRPTKAGNTFGLNDVDYCLVRWMRTLISSIGRTQLRVDNGL